MTEKTRDGIEWVAACHEAGHAVGAVLLDMPFLAVAIETDGSGNGGMESITCKQIREQGLWRLCAIVAELGPAVESSLFHAKNSGCWSDDRAIVSQAAKECFAGQKANRRAFKRAIADHAQKIIQTPGFIDAVNAVARELIRSRRLDRGEVVAIVHETFPQIDPAIRSLRTALFGPRLTHWGTRQTL